MNSQRILTVLLLSVVFAVEYIEATCLNDHDFRQYGSVRRSCSWIRYSEVRRQKACLDEDVLSHCPQTCGECCENDPSYTFENDMGLTKSCEWIAQKLKRQRKYCTNRNAGEIKNYCPLACGECKPPINAPKQSGSCEDNEFFRYKGASFKSCEWIGRLSSRRENACSNDEVLKHCPRSCRTCCKDDTSFILETENQREKKCGWLENHPIRQNKYCKNLNRGALVENKCPVSCGICTPNESPIPSVISESPSIAPSSFSSSFFPSGVFSERPTATPSESGLCKIEAILSFPSEEEAYDGYHNDELSVTSEKSNDECSIINQARSWCEHSGEDGLVQKDPYDGTFVSRSESVSFEAESDILYTLRVDHKFITSAGSPESYYYQDHLMAGTLKIEANGEVIGNGFTRDVYEDVDTFLGLDKDKMEYIINPDYDALLEVTVKCDLECECVTTKTN